MNRCSRLIEEEFINCEAATEPLFLQKGDRMTGWEIIASLPIEEQQGNKLREKIRLMVNMTYGAAMFFEQLKYKDIIDMLSMMFEYNGEGWDEVKE